jgi:transcriptional pleiotropic regulator of transition state genes
MKSTGVVRRIDELGRIVLPIEIRRSLDINVKDPVEIFIDNERIVLQKYSPACIS